MNIKYEYDEFGNVIKTIENFGESDEFSEATVITNFVTHTVDVYKKPKRHIEFITIKANISENCLNFYEDFLKIWEKNNESDTNLT